MSLHSRHHKTRELTTTTASIIRSIRCVQVSADHAGFQFPLCISAIWSTKCIRLEQWSKLDEWTSGTADQSLHIRTANRCKGLDFNWLNALNLTNDSHEGQCSYIQMYYNCSGCMGKLPLRFTAAHSNRSGSIYLVGMDRSIGLSYYNQRNQAQSMD